MSLGYFSYFAGMWFDVNCDTEGIGVICQDKAMEPAKGKISSGVIFRGPQKNKSPRH